MTRTKTRVRRNRSKGRRLAERQEEVYPAYHVGRPFQADLRVKQFLPFALNEGNLDRTPLSKPSIISYPYVLLLQRADGAPRVNQRLGGWIHCATSALASLRTSRLDESDSPQKETFLLT